MWETDAHAAEIDQVLARLGASDFRRRFRLREASAVLLAALWSFRRACVPGGEKHAAIASERHYSRVCGRYCLWNITNFNIGFS